MASIAIYPGSFDPFTCGHMDIVKKAARLFSHLYVVIGVNTDKARTYDASRMRDAIARTVADAGIENCTVCLHTGLTAAFAKEVGADCLVRGLRNSLDYGYEENIAAVNKLLCPTLETVYLRADHAAVSASMVRELRRFGESAAAYVPPAVLGRLRKIRCKKCFFSEKDCTSFCIVFTAQMCYSKRKMRKCGGSYDRNFPQPDP